MLKSQNITRVKAKLAETVESLLRNLHQTYSHIYTKCGEMIEKKVTLKQESGEVYDIEWDSTALIVTHRENETSNTVLRTYKFYVLNGIAVNNMVSANGPIIGLSMWRSHTVCHSSLNYSIKMANDFIDIFSKLLTSDDLVSLLYSYVPK